MNRTHVALVGSIVAVSILFAFQNCSNQYGQRGNKLANFSSSLTGLYPPKEIIVKMNSAPMDQALHDWANSKGLTLHNHWTDVHMSHWSWTEDATVQDMQVLFASQAFASGMDFSEPNYIYELPPASVLAATNGAVYAAGMIQTAANAGQVAVRTQLTPNRPPVVVAVIDSGVDLTHEVFTGAEAVWENPGEIPGNGIDDDGNGYRDDVNGFNFINGNGNLTDDNGHGTHCAGIVLGTGLDIFARPLAKSNIKIMGVKFIGQNGQGSTSAAINGIYYAVNNGAKVLSNSWGGPSPSQALEMAIAYAYDHDVAFVAAAGNESANTDVTPNFPSNYMLPQVLSVAATANDDSLAGFSNFGPRTVNIAAPGVGILSSVPGNKYANYSGTSMATPFVAGTAALMYYQRSGINSYEVKEIIEAQADRIALNGKVMMNRRLNVAKAVATATTQNLTGTKPGYKLSYGSNSDGGPGGGGCGLVMSTKGTPPSPPPMALLILPLAVFAYLRVRATTSYQPARAS